MGNKAHRKDALNTAAAAITNVAQTGNPVKCNGKLLSVDGSIGTGHPSGPPHSAGTWKTANGSSTVNAGGIPVNSETDADTCTHTRTGGSSNVNIG